MDMMFVSTTTLNESLNLRCCITIFLCLTRLVNSLETFLDGETKLGSTISSDETGTRLQVSEEGEEVLLLAGEYNNFSINKIDETYWKCRHNPTWKTGGVDYNECEELMGWYPRGDWYNSLGHLRGEEQTINTCLHVSLQDILQKTKLEQHR